MSGAKASESSAWKLDTSQTTVVASSTSPTSAESGVPTFPASATGRPASRQIAPSSSVVVVLPLVPVTATKRFGKQPPGQLELAEHRQPALARGHDHRRLVRHARALHHHRRALEQLHPVHAEMRLDVARNVRRARVGADHLAVRRQHARRRDPGAREPDDQVRAIGERRPHEPGIEAW